MEGGGQCAFNAQALLQPFLHLFGGLVAKGQQQDLFGPGFAAGHQIGHPAHGGAGFAGACPRQHQIVVFIDHAGAALAVGQRQLFYPIKEFAVTAEAALYRLFAGVSQQPFIALGQGPGQLKLLTNLRLKLWQLGARG